MIFEQDDLSFHLLDVLELKQKDINMYNCGRNFGALSFRFRADTRFKTEKREYVLKENSVVYVPPRVDYERIADVDEFIVIHFDTPSYQSDEIEYFNAGEDEILKEKFTEILNAWTEKQEGYLLECGALLYEIFARCRVLNGNEKKPRSKIAPSVEYLLKNYKRKDLSIEAIAEKSFMCEVYFRRIFKREYGVSPQAYIIRLRLQNAIGLISSGYYSLKEVARLSGYEDYKYFATEFKRYTGVSPSKYRYNYGK